MADITTSYTYTLNVSYNANGGTGAPSGQSFSRQSTSTTSVTVSGTVSNTKPTRSGYSFLYWSSSQGTYYSGNTISRSFTYDGGDQTKSVTLTAQWKEDQYRSSWGTTPSSVELDGSTSYTFNINKSSDADHHTATLTLGEQVLTFNTVNTSFSTTFPVAWQNQLPNSATGQIVASLTTYDSNNKQIGSVTNKTITANVPASVVPTLSFTHTAINDNPTINGWGILVQGFSRIQFTATCAGVNGADIESVTFSGAGLQQTATARTGRSGILIVAGSRTWTISCKDTRGRVTSTTYTETVYEYTPPSISSVSARRCSSNGTINEANGTYALFLGDYSYSSVNGNNVCTQKIDYKLHTGSTWTTLANSYTSGTSQVIGGGAFNADKTYDVRLQISDSIGNSAEFSVFVASVQGFALGLKNDRARFGGVPTKAGLVCDWDAEFSGDVSILGDLTANSMSVSAPTTTKRGGFTFDSGTDSVTHQTNNGYSTHAVTFSSAFSSAPLVFAFITNVDKHLGRCMVTCTNITANGFDLNFINYSDASVSMNVAWIALGT